MVLAVRVSHTLHVKRRWYLSLLGPFSQKYRLVGLNKTEVCMYLLCGNACTLRNVFTVLKPTQDAKQRESAWTRKAAIFYRLVARSSLEILEGSRRRSGDDRHSSPVPHPLRSFVCWMAVFFDEHEETFIVILHVFFVTYEVQHEECTYMWKVSEWTKDDKYSPD